MSLLKSDGHRVDLTGLSFRKKLILKIYFYFFRFLVFCGHLYGRWQARPVQKDIFIFKNSNQDLIYFNYKEKRYSCRKISYVKTENYFIIRNIDTEKMHFFEGVLAESLYNQMFFNASSEYDLSETIEQLIQNDYLKESNV